MCLVVVLFLSALVGLDHYFTASTAAIIVMLLLAWKLELEPLRRSPPPRGNLLRRPPWTPQRRRLSPPPRPLRRSLATPQSGQYWITVVVIAGIGFINYVLLRLYGNRGLLYAVPSSAALSIRPLPPQNSPPCSRAARPNPVALCCRPSPHQRRHGDSQRHPARYLRPRGTRSRNWPIGPDGNCRCRAIVVPQQSERTAQLCRVSNSPPPSPSAASPNSASFFLLIACIGTLAQRFYGGDRIPRRRSVLGGLVSAASTTASAATLVVAGKLRSHHRRHRHRPHLRRQFLVDLPIVAQQTRSKRLIADLTAATLIIAFIGIAAAAVVWWWKI